MKWRCYSQEEIQKISQACKITGKLLAELSSFINVGISTLDIDLFAENFINKSGGRPAFKGYHGYPFTICSSVNDQIVHGMPSKDRFLEEGDIVSVDVGTYLEGFYSDAARTFSVGNISDERQRLIDVTKKSFFKGLEAFKEGTRLYSVSSQIQKEIETEGFFVVRDYVGHGIGKELHEEPQIPNYGKFDTGPQLELGMVVAIEPMVLSEESKTKVEKDGWTVSTVTGCDAAHHENTIALLETGPEVLTCVE